MERSSGMITADQLRVKNEKESLTVAIIVTVIIFVVILGISLFVFIIPLIFAVFYVKTTQGSYLGNAVKITERQFPDIYNTVYLAAERLSMPQPDVFIRQTPVIQAHAIGIWGRKSVVLTSALVETMKPSELACIIGHEFTHIKCEHTSWGILANLHNSIPIPVISNLLSFIFLSWARKAEYTCDRGGLIVSQDVSASVAAIAKLAVGKQLFEKLDLDSFKGQKSEVSKDDISRLSELLLTHPFFVNRIQKMNIYFNSASYRRLTSGVGKYDFDVFHDDLSSVQKESKTESEVEDKVSYCTECGNDLSKDDLICLNCGAIRE